MKRFFLIIFILFLCSACQDKKQTADKNWRNISQNVQFQKDEQVFKLKSGRFIYEIPLSELPFKKVLLLNASLVGYFTELQLEHKIAGISSPEYVYSPKMKQLIAKGHIQNLGNEQKYDVEKILALNPEAIFTNYVASFENTYNLIRQKGIKIIFLDEYMEQNPLEKSAYLRVFGELLGAQEMAENRYQQIVDNYHALASLAKKSHQSPTVLANEMYGNQWFLPGGKTSLAMYLKDANAQYINAGNPAEKAVPMSFEEVFSKSQEATFWVNVGNHKHKKELLQINPNYAEMNVYTNGKLYTVSGREAGSSNDYFESGVVRADLVLKDYIKIFHPQLLTGYNLTYLKPLN